jgi:uncharacterized protein (TIGR02246 family)
MRTLLTVAIAVAVLVSFTPTVLAQSAEDEAAIRGLVKEINDAFNERNAEGMASCIVENFENLEGKQKGRKEMSEYWASMKGQYKQLDEIGIHFLTPDIAIFREHGENTGLFDADGKPLPTRRVVESWVAIKKDGKWLLAAFFNRPVEE